MNVLFEEDGAFKAGVVLADNTASLQVETTSGRRTKIKAANVLLRFAEPAPAALLERAESEAEGFDTDFLWEASGDDEFAFEELARDYYGHPPLPAEAAAILLRLHAAPIYFHRKGKGRFRKAPPDILKAALAGLEKKRQQALAVERMTGELKQFRLPAEFQPLLPQLLYKPDRNRLETKALELACAETGLSAPHLLSRCGALASSHDYHLGRFLFEFFSGGTAFAAYAAVTLPADLPRARVRAFSVDDATTTEIDDAFSVSPLEDGGYRVGIHIAAPGLGFAPGSDLDALARKRLSTVYMPGRKITMLPDEVVEHFTLAAGTERPSLSLYLDVNADVTLAGSESRIERVPVVANLRHHDIEPLFNEQTLVDGGPDFAFKQELTFLWELANVLEAGRGKPAANQGLLDYNFYVDWDSETAHGPGRITIDQRKRGSPLDKLVAELMIVANTTWGKLLADRDTAGIYRAQSAGKVRMTTVAAPHDGLGVEQYAWSSSPLRRYVDLVNQWQIIACLQGVAPPFAVGAEALLAAMSDFELTYAAYGEFQRNMERYWCLRWLLQEGVTTAAASVVRETLVRLERMPLFLRVPSLPASDPGTRVTLNVERIDLLDLTLDARYVNTLSPDEPTHDLDPALATE
jgi:exoribonuclease-2